MIVIAHCCHAQILNFVGVVMYIDAYHLLSACYLSTYCYMCLLTRFYGIIASDIEVFSIVTGDVVSTLYVNIKSSCGMELMTHQIVQYLCFIDSSGIRQ